MILTNGILAYGGFSVMKKKGGEGKGSSVVAVVSSRERGTTGVVTKY